MRKNPLEPIGEIDVGDADEDALVAKAAPAAGANRRHRKRRQPWNAKRRWCYQTRHCSRRFSDGRFRSLARRRRRNPDGYPVVMERTGRSYGRRSESGSYLPLVVAAGVAAYLLYRHRSASA